jgi:hypothetical protein
MGQILAGELEGVGAEGEAEHSVIQLGIEKPGQWWNTDRADTRRGKLPMSLKCIPRTCKWCNSSFLATKQQVTNGQGRFCSRPCHRKWRDATSIQRFWEKVGKTDDLFSCWLWTGAINPRSGYGDIRWQNRHLSTHRLAWELTNGPIPAGLWVLHHCDCKPCCRPEHLYVGTHQDNVADRIDRERSPHGDRWREIYLPIHQRGSECSFSKLTEEAVREIRLLHSQGVSIPELARRFNVARATIRPAVLRITWKHVE